VKKAKKQLGEVGSDEPARAPEVPSVSTGQAGSRDAGQGTAKSVESMLREFSSVGTDVPVTGGPQRGKYDQLWQLSMADPHTGLANQLLLLDRLTQALVRRRRHGGEVVVCHIDLDNLAEINLDLGYTTGNTVLGEMSRRLTSVLRAEDTIGRVGGSELVVVLAVTDEQVVGPLLRRLQRTLDEPVTVGGQDIRLSSSLGVAVADDSESAEDVLARADRSTRVGRH
jgi:two-component system, chemotaxis family, CheB/CheR fusion protein